MLTRRLFLGTACGSIVSACRPHPAPLAGAAITLLNVSYDATRELYRDINPAFSRLWQSEPGHGPVDITMSHGGSAAQARAVLDGLAANVVTLASPFEIDQIAAAGLTDRNWRARLPNNSAPYTSIIVFVVRRDNPKRVADWSDLIRDGVAVVAADPKTSGGARWSYLAAWAYARRSSGNDAATRAFMQRLYAHTTSLDVSVRGSRERFVSGEGDVLLSWENEAQVLSQSSEYEIVRPSLTIRAEPAIALIDAHTQNPDVRSGAEAYLRFLYTLEGQTIIARNYYRPFDASVIASNASRFPGVPFVTIGDAFLSWQDAYAVHFRDGGVFDQIRGKP